MVAGNQPRMPEGALERRAYHDCEHCNGDGLCLRPSQREPDRNGRGAFRLYSDH